MNDELLLIVGDWVARTIPHFSVESYMADGWLGWLKCPCELKHGATIARIEEAQICFIATSGRFYDQEHQEACTAKERNPVSRHCYCGETVVKIHDAEGFANLERTIKSTHTKLVQRRRMPR